MNEVDFRTMNIIKAIFLSLVLSVIVWFIIGGKYGYFVKSIFCICGFVVSISIMGWLSRCKKCKKQFCTEKISNELLRQDVVQGNKEIKGSNGKKRIVNAAYEVSKFRVFTKCEECGYKDSYIVTDKKEI